MAAIRPPSVVIALLYLSVPVLVLGTVGQGQPKHRQALPSALGPAEQMDIRPNILSEKWKPTGAADYTQYLSTIDLRCSELCASDTDDGRGLPEKRRT